MKATAQIWYMAYGFSVLILINRFTGYLHKNRGIILFMNKNTDENVVFFADLYQLNECRSWFW